MKKETREMLESLIQDRLNKAMTEEENSGAFDEAMKAIDRQLEIDKREFELEKEQIRQQFDTEKEKNRQHFELDKENDRQQFELDKEDKRQEFESLKESNKMEHELAKDELNRQHELERDRIRNDYDINKENLITERELKKIKAETNKANVDRAIKCVELLATVVAVPLIEAGCKRAFAEMLCEFEKDYNFTTMAGKSLSGLFKFRR